MSRRRTRWSVKWSTAQVTLFVVEPTAGEVASAAGQLAAFYNDAHNRIMLGHTQDASSSDVRTHFQTLWAAGGRPLLLFAGDKLVGDADLRQVRGDTAEFAILLGDRAQQGRGLGTRFSVMVHALAFGVLGLGCVYVSIVAHNPASERSLSKVGYRIDNSPIARGYIDDAGDLTMSLSKDRFDRTQGRAVASMHVQVRPGR